MSGAIILCICGHSLGSHGPVLVDGVPLCDFCSCDKFVEQRGVQVRATSEFPAAAPLADFGVPSALRGPFALSEAAHSAALGALVELRLLIAAVDDVLSQPAPRVQTSRAPTLSEVKAMADHRSAIERLAMGQRNARGSLRRVDDLREQTQPPTPARSTVRTLPDLEAKDNERAELVIAARSILVEHTGEGDSGRYVTFAKGVLEHLGEAP